MFLVKFVNSIELFMLQGKQGWDENSAEETYRKAAEEIMPLIA